MPRIQSCKECFETEFQKKNCAYEHAKDYASTYDFFKNKWGEEFPNLLAGANALVAEANACKEERNAAMPLLEQQKSMKEFHDEVRSLKDAIESLTEQLGGKPPKQKAAPKQSSNKFTPWRPDIKEENIPEAIEQLKAKYPSLTDADIFVSDNQNGHKSIRFKAPS